jgi:hypothetical protein
VDSALGEERQTGKRGIRFVSYAQLTIAEEGWSRQRGRRLNTRAFCKLVAAARKEQFGAKPGSVALRRRWQMNFLLPH